MIDLILVALGLAGALAAGRILLKGIGWSSDRALEELLFATAVGLLALQLVLLLIGLAGWLHPVVLLGLGLGWAGLGLWGAMRSGPWPATRLKAWQGLLGWYHYAGLAVAGGVVLFDLVRALAPPFGQTDPLAYNLALPKLYLQSHALSFEPTINGALYPAGVGLLYLLGIAMGGDSMPQVVHLILGLLTAGSIVGLGQRLTTTRAGLWGAILFLLTPVVVYYGSLGYVDLGLGYFQLLAFWALFGWLDRRDRRHLLVAALLTGAAMSVKPHGALTLPVGLGLMLAARPWQGTWRPWGADALVFTGLALAVVAPWYARSYVHAGNPVWPLANAWFGGLEFGPSDFGLPGFVLSLSASNQGAGGLPSFVAGAWDRFASQAGAFWRWTWHPQTWQHAIGSHYLALLPGLALVRRPRGVVRLIWFGLAYYVLAILLQHANPRYNLVLLGLLALLCGHVVDEVMRSRSRWAGIAVAVVVILSGSLIAAWSFYMARPVLPVVRGEVPVRRFLETHESTYRLFEFVNARLPPRSHLLLQGIVKGYYCDRPYLWDHPFQRVVHYPDYPTVEDLARRLQELGVTHVARMITIPPSRVRLGYPQYFDDPFHEAFRRRYLRLLYRDNGYVLFAVRYPSSGVGMSSSKSGAATSGDALPVASGLGPGAAP